MKIVGALAGILLLIVSAFAGVRFWLNINETLSMEKYITDYSDVKFFDSRTSEVIKKCTLGDFRSTLPMPSQIERSKATAQDAMMSPDEMFTRLLSESEMSEDLISTLAGSLLQQGAITDATALWQCNALHNQNIFSAYRLMRLYQDGTQEIAKLVTKPSVYVEVNPDDSKTYFWAAVVTHLGKQEGLDPFDVSTPMGYQMLSTVDGLQNTGKLSSEERIAIEKDAMALVDNKYPVVLKDPYTYRLEAHSMESYSASVRAQSVTTSSNSIAVPTLSISGVQIEDSERAAQNLCVPGIAMVTTFKNDVGLVGGFMTIPTESAQNSDTKIYSGEGKLVASTADSNIEHFSSVAKSLSEQYPQTLATICETFNNETVVGDVEPGTSSIGVATMLEDGTIIMDLRAEGLRGVSGLARDIIHPDSSRYEDVLNHLGGLKPGESKQIPPWD